MPLYHEDRLLAVIGITGSPEKVRKYAFLAQRITSLLIREQELGQYSRHQADKKQFVISSLLHGDTQNPEYLLKCLREFQIDPDTPKRLILLHTYPAASSQNLSVKIDHRILESQETPASRTDTENPNLSRESSLQAETHDSDSGIGSVLSEHQIRNFFKTIGSVLYTFRYPGDYLAVTDSSGFLLFPEHFVILRKSMLALWPCCWPVRTTVSAWSFPDYCGKLPCENLDFHRPLTDHVCAKKKIMPFSMISLWKIVLSSVSPDDREEFSGKNHSSAVSG